MAAEVIACGRRQGFAAVPEHRFEQVAGPTVMQELAVAADGAGQADAPQRRGTPVAAAGEELGTVVRQARTHVMQQQITVGADHLAGQLRFGGGGRGGELRGMAVLAASLVKQCLAGQHLRRTDVPAGWNGQVAGVEQHQAQDVVADFLFAVGTVAVGGVAAGGLIEGPQSRGEAHVTRKGVNVLLIEVGLPGFPAEAAEYGFTQGIVPDPVRPPGDAIAGRVFRVGENRFLGNRLQQAQPDHRRGDAGGKARVRVHRTVTQLADHLRSSTSVPSLKRTGTGSYSTRTLPSGTTPGMAMSCNWPP